MTGLTGDTATMRQEYSRECCEVEGAYLEAGAGSPQTLE